MVAMKLRWRAYPLPLDGCPRRTAAISSKEAHVTSHSITSTLLLSMLTRLQTSPVCLPYGERACRRTAMLFSSPESSTLKGTLSWWRDFDNSNGRHDRDGIGWVYPAGKTLDWRSLLTDLSLIHIGGMSLAPNFCPGIPDCSVHGLGRG